jgi:phage repressor protein C with HTH and peptisase S24 domain
LLRAIPRAKGAGEDATGLSQFVLLPRRATAAAAGVPIAPDPDWLDSEYLALRQDWIRSVIGVDPAHVGLEIAAGDSMVPTIQHGDVLLIDTSDQEFAQYGIYVLEIEGERLVKRVQRKLDGSLTLISDNPSYERDFLPTDKAASVRAVGRVVWAGGLI